MLVTKQQTKPYFSPSQIKTAATCMRKWNGENVQGWRQPDAPHLLLGKDVHRVMEEYLRDEKIPDPADPAGAIFLPGAKYLPEPKTPFLLVEQEVRIPADEFNTHKDLFGFLDVTVLQHVDPDGTVWLLVIDGKTTSDLKYAKSEDELRRDPQALIYCWAARQLTIGALGYTPENIRFAHVYFRTRGGPASLRSSVDFTEDELREGLKELASLCQEMARWDGKSFDEVPANINACGAYGGCHLRPECAQTGLLVYGDSPEAIAAAMLRTTRLDKETKTMGLLSNKSLAALALGKVLAPTAPAAEPATAAINPPDGDADGVSGQAVDPDANPETDEEVVERVLGVAVPAEDTEDVEPAVEEQAAPVEPTPEPAQPTDVLSVLAPAPETNPDKGYTEPSPPVVEPTTASRGRPSEKPEMWDRIEQQVRQLREDPASWSRAQQISHDLASKIISGKVKFRANNIRLDQLQELVRILDGALANDMARLAAAPAAPKPQTTETPLEQARKRRDEQKLALVSAKGALAASLQQLQVLNDKRADTLDDDDEAAYNRYNTEVYLPARKRVAAGEKALAEAEQQLVEAEAAEEKRLADERAAKEREAEEKARAEAAQLQTQQAESKAADVAQLLSLASLQEQRVGGRKHGCILLKGCIPTRKVNRGNFMHIDELINPHRKAVEAAAMTSYYKTTAKGGDPATRICEEILTSLVNGTLQLPPYIVAPARTNFTQDAVIDALSPYFEDVFATLA